MESEKWEGIKSTRDREMNRESGRIIEVKRENTRKEGRVREIERKERNKYKRLKIARVKMPVREILIIKLNFYVP